MKDETKPSGTNGQPQNEIDQGSLAELKKLEEEASKKGAEKQPKIEAAANPDSKEGAPATAKDPADGSQVEKTIRFSLRSWWRFRAWLAKRSLGLPEEYFGAILADMDAALVEPMVEPVVNCINLYVPEVWMKFIEEKAPLLLLLMAIFEAEQSFGERIEKIREELKSGATAKKEEPAPQRTTTYPAPGEV